MAQDSQSVSCIFQSMPQFSMIKDKIELGSIHAESVLKKIQAKFNDAKADTRDGLKLSWNHSWMHIRKSNTEPIIRIYAEASSEDSVQKLVDSVKRCIL